MNFCTSHSHQNKLHSGPEFLISVLRQQQLSTHQTLPSFSSFSTLVSVYSRRKYVPSPGCRHQGPRGTNYSTLHLWKWAPMQLAAWRWVPFLIPKFKEIFPHHSTASHFVCNWMHTKCSSHVWCEHTELGRFQYVAVYHKIKLPHYKETNITIFEPCVWLKWGNNAKTNMFFAAVNDKPTDEICQNDISLSLIISQTM